VPTFLTKVAKSTQHALATITVIWFIEAAPTGIAGVWVTPLHALLAKLSDVVFRTLANVSDVNGFRDALSTVEAVLVIARCALLCVERFQ